MAGSGGGSHNGNANGGTGPRWLVSEGKVRETMAQAGFKWAATVVGAGLIVLFSAAAWAQESGEEGVIYKKKTVVSFGDDTIDGDLTKPDGDYVESRKRVRHSNLIKIREDFREKILNSISTL